MSYTPTTWTTGDTITATKLNKIENGIVSASPYDAVIRLTHSNDSGQDITDNLTPSIISGTYADLHSKISNGGFPHIIVQYYHPWGFYGFLEGYITYSSETGIWIKSTGFYPFGNTGGHFYYLDLLWTSSDTILWD